MLSTAVPEPPMTWHLASAMHLWLGVRLDGQHGCCLLSALSEAESCAGTAMQRHQRCWVNGTQALQSSSPLISTCCVCQL